MRTGYFERFLYRKFVKIFIISVLIAFLPGCKKKLNQSQSNTQTITSNEIVPTEELKNITFLPYWVANAQFAGYYMAVEKGIYRKYGLNLTVIPFQPFVTSTDLIKEKKADFAALWLANAIGLRATGTDIVNIAQPSTRSSVMLITKKSSGINSIQDMNGKKAGIWSGFELQPKAFFRKNQLDVNIIPIGSTNNLFLMNGVDITIANWFDEYHSILNSGLDPDELNTFFFADYGLNFLEDGIYCLTEKRKNDPEVCLFFLKATLEGWDYAFNHPDETIDVVVKYAQESKLPVNRVHQRWMLDRYKDLYYSEGSTHFNSRLLQSDYESVGSVLIESGLISNLPSFDDFYKPMLKSEAK